MAKSTYEELREDFYNNRKSSTNFASCEPYNNGSCDCEHDDDDADCCCD